MTKLKALMVSFLNKAARKFGNIRADLAKAGTPIGPYDLQIAAIALVNSLILVTHNTRESYLQNAKFIDLITHKTQEGAYAA